jgi:hypothetical protein
VSKRQVDQNMVKQHSSEYPARWWRPARPVGQTHDLLRGLWVGCNLG